MWVIYIVLGMAKEKEYKRKLINANGAAYINIPSDVIRKMGWNYGDEITLYPNSTGIFISSPKVYTLGYEGLSLNSFMKILKEHNILQVIDIRDTPWSANPVFRRGYLDKILTEKGIFYYNLTKLGAPRALRQIIDDKGYPEFFERYREHLKENIKYFTLLMKLINNGATLLLCYERDWKICHRKIVAEELEKRGYKVVHIER